MPNPITSFRVERIASFDPAIKHFAIAIEDVTVDHMIPLRSRWLSLPKSQQRKYRGKTNSAVDHILTKVCKSGRVVYTKLLDLNEDSANVQAKMKLIAYLNRHRELFLSCDQFVIEQQFFTSFGGKTRVNMDAVRIAEVPAVWLLMNGVLPECIHYIMTSAKTDVLCAPKMTKHHRKKWSVNKVREILDVRGDSDTLGAIASAKKADDISDCICQIQAFKYLHYICHAL